MKVGSIIDDKYNVVDTCSSIGGMGEVLLVVEVGDFGESIKALKYCKMEDQKLRKRFIREIRLMEGFHGNTRVAEILDSNSEHEPPYYVMPYYPEGDICSLVAELEGNPAAQERIFLEMIDCVRELHKRGELHRDIKPQNFLRTEHGLVISDFGLSVELESMSAYTSTLETWGTPEYLPPEFVKREGFRDADFRSDIYMLGKAFFHMLTGEIPLFLNEEKIHPAFYLVIEKCCVQNPDHRYQNLNSLGQALVNAFDIVLERKAGLGKAKQVLVSINELLEKERKFRSTELEEFLDLFASIDSEDAKQLSMEIGSLFFQAVAREAFADRVERFLKRYSEMVVLGSYGWSFAETIAKNMRYLFMGKLRVQDRAKALELAIHAAIEQNRFAAMETCTEMIESIEEGELAMLASDFIRGNPDSFLAGIQPAKCKHDLVIKAIKGIGAQSEDDED